MIQLIILIFVVFLLGCGRLNNDKLTSVESKQKNLFSEKIEKNSLNRQEIRPNQLNDIDTSKFTIQYIWNNEPYIADGSLNHVIKINFLTKKAKKIISSFDVINSNPYLEYSFLTKTVVYPEDYCYLPYDLSKEKNQHPVFLNSDNVVLQCPFVTTTNNKYTAISYNAICKSGEWPFKYISNMIILNNQGKIVFNSDNLQTSCEGIRISTCGEFLMYHYETFNIDDDYPDEQGVRLVNIGQSFKFKELNIKSEYQFITPYIVNENPKTQGNIVLGLFNFDTYELMIKEIPLSSYSQVKITKEGLHYSLISQGNEQQENQIFRFNHDFIKINF